MQYAWLIIALYAAHKISCVVYSLRRIENILSKKKDADDNRELV